MKQGQIQKIVFFTFLIGAFFTSAPSFSQQKDTTNSGASIVKNLTALTISGFVDAYYAYYTDSVGTNNYQKFPSISPRSNQVGLNIALLTAQYDAEKVRGIVALQFGDTPKSTWSGTYNNIMEAHAGMRLCKKLWIDAGFFRTHFGTEGLLPKENITSSISVNTFYEPYFESGVRLNYNPSDKLAINLYALNGYNVYEDNNKKKSFGMLVTYALGDKGNVGYSNYIGDDSPDSDSLPRTLIHQNLFFNYQVKKLKIQIGEDYCIKANADIATGNETATMYSGIFSLKYQIKEKFAVYGRGEGFNDPQGIMSGVITDKKGKLTGLKLWGTTLGVEYKPTENSYVRLEGRQLLMNEDQEIFRWNGKNEDTRMEMLINIGISF